MKGQYISLRPVEFTDAPTLMLWENDEANWEVSERETPYTFSEIIQLIDSSKNLEDCNQLRWMIVHQPTLQTIGTLDLFDWRPAEKVIAIGVLIQDERNRKQGFAYEALQLAEAYLENFRIDRIDCTIQESNLVSLRLFKKAGYVHSSLPQKKGEFKMEKWLRK